MSGECYQQINKNANEVRVGHTFTIFKNPFLYLTQSIPRTSTGSYHGQTATIPQTWRVVSQHEEMISPKAHWTLCNPGGSWRYELRKYPLPPLGGKNSRGQHHTSALHSTPLWSNLLFLQRSGNCYDAKAGMFFK